VLQDKQVIDGAEEAAAGRHPVQGLCLRRHLRPLVLPVVFGLIVVIGVYGLGWLESWTR
jgi:hypothetical protein